MDSSFHPQLLLSGMGVHSALLDEGIRHTSPISKFKMIN